MEVCIQILKLTFSFLILIAANVKGFEELNGQDTVGFGPTGFGSFNDNTEYEHKAVRRSWILSEDDKTKIDSRRRRHLQTQSGMIKLSWPPIKKKRSLLDGEFSFYVTGNLVDHDSTGSIQDYTCGQIAYNGHSGIDLSPFPFPWISMDEEDENMEVVAIAPGIILHKYDGYYDRECTFNLSDSNDVRQWNGVNILHDDGRLLAYGHFKKNSLLSKDVGQRVERGEVLGIVGSSGYSTEPHLHIELFEYDNNFQNERSVDPFAGSCNSISINYWLFSQPPYPNGKINRLTTGLQPAVVSTQCNTPRTPNVQNDFSKPSAPNILKIYLTAYFGGWINGQTYTSTIFDPNGNTVSTWSDTLYSTSRTNYASFYLALDSSLVEGRWKWRMEFGGTTYDKAFAIRSKEDDLTINTKWMTIKDCASTGDSYVKPFSAAFPIDTCWAIPALGLTRKISGTTFADVFYSDDHCTSVLKQDNTDIGYCRDTEPTEFKNDIILGPLSSPVDYFQKFFIVFRDNQVDCSQANARMVFAIGLTTQAIGVIDQTKCSNYDSTYMSRVYTQGFTFGSVSLLIRSDDNVFLKVYASSDCSDQTPMYETSFSLNSDFSNIVCSPASSGTALVYSSYGVTYKYTAKIRFPNGNFDTTIHNSAEFKESVRELILRAYCDPTPIAACNIQVNITSITAGSVVVGADITYTGDPPSEVKLESQLQKTMERLLSNNDTFLNLALAVNGVEVEVKTETLREECGGQSENGGKLDGSACITENGPRCNSGFQLDEREDGYYCFACERDTWGNFANLANSNLCFEEDESEPNGIFYKDVFAGVDFSIVPTDEFSCGEYGIRKKYPKWIKGGLRNSQRPKSNDQVALIDIMIGGKISLEFSLNGTAPNAVYVLYIYDLDTGRRLHRTQVTVLEGNDPQPLTQVNNLDITGNTMFTSSARRTSTKNILNPCQLDNDQSRSAIKVGFNQQNKVKIAFEVIKEQDRYLNNRRSILFSIERL